MPYKNLHPLYYVWTSMIQRCHLPTNRAFQWYGARGISVCDRWRGDFAAFVADMSDRPPGYSIDRIDVGGNYEPGNCRWASDAEQQRNRTNTKLSKAMAEEIAEKAKLPGSNNTRLGAEYGVSRTMIRKIVQGKSWAS